MNCVALGIAETIQREISSWKDVTVVPHRFGGIEFRVGKFEMGHLHGDVQADLPFSAKLRKELVRTGKASLHHLYPNSGWVTYYIHGQADIPDLLALFRRNYERLVSRPISQCPT